MIARKQTRENRAWKAAAIIMIAVLLAGLIGICILAEYGSEQYADNVLRLHVIANSNTSEDQALKLKVQRCRRKHCSRIGRRRFQRRRDGTNRAGTY